MFDQTFVNGKEHAWKSTLAFSLTIQSVLVSLMILIPLVYTQAFPQARIREFLIGPRPPAGKPVSQAKAASAQSASLETSRRLIAPTITPHVIPKRSDASMEPAPVVTGTESSGAGGSGDGNELFGVIGSVSEPTVPPSPSKPAPAPVHLSSGVAQANLIYRVQPAYPQLAKVTRVQGTVEFTATISREGRIENLTLVRGHQLLVKAAQNAILQWRYKPTLLNGVPVEVVTDILVNFTLTQ